MKLYRPAMSVTKLSTSKYHRWLEEWEKMDFELVIANDFKSFVRENGLTYVRTSPTTLRATASWNADTDHSRAEFIRPGSPATKEEADRRITKYVSYYNTVRMHSAIGTIILADCLEGICKVIGKERDRKSRSGLQISSKETDCIETSCLAPWKRLQQRYLHER